MEDSRKKLNAIDPGEILNEEFLLPMNISQYRLARNIGVDPRRIHAIIHGERSITAETALLLSRYNACRAPVAQRIEQRFPKPCVGCSSHPRGTIS